MKLITAEYSAKYRLTSFFYDLTNIPWEYLDSPTSKVHAQYMGSLISMD